MSLRLCNLQQVSGAVSSYDTTAQADRKPTVGIVVETRRSENVLNFEQPPRHVYEMARRCEAGQLGLFAPC